MKEPSFEPSSNMQPAQMQPAQMQPGQVQPDGSVLLSWRGETLQLLPQGALFWPRTGTVFLADLHLGKSAGFRAHGLPVPHGSTQDNLQRLQDLMVRHAVRQCVLLGDWLHMASGRTPAVLGAWCAWRNQHPDVVFTLVRGNHDRHAGEPPPLAQMAVVEEPWTVGPFAACHHPQAHATHGVLAGHLHPVCVLRGPGGDRLRLPCFVLDAQHLILPAFGAFTGGHPVPARGGQQRYALGGGRVWCVPEAELSRDNSALAGQLRPSP